MRAFSAVFFTLLLMLTLVTVSYIPQTRATGSIYIKSDGSIEPSTAPISTLDNVTYSLTDNITSDTDGIIIERNNIVLDGVNHRIQGGSLGNGIFASGRANVSITNIEVDGFEYGVYLNSCLGCNVNQNLLTGNWAGIYLLLSSGNNIIGNIVAADLLNMNGTFGIWLASSNYNNVAGNKATNNSYAVMLQYCRGNEITGNEIFGNQWYGFYLIHDSETHIAANNITGQPLPGIMLTECSDNEIIGNAFTDDGGLFVYNSKENTVAGNVINGKSLVYLEDTLDYTVTDAGQVILVDCDNITMQNLNITTTYAGLELTGTNNSILTASIMRNVDRVVLEGFNNTLLDNDLEARVFLTGEENTVRENNLTSSGDCLTLLNCSRTTVRENNVITPSLSTGVAIEDSNSNDISRNCIANRHSGMWFERATNNSVFENAIQNNHYGIDFVNSSDNAFCHNTFANNSFDVVDFGWEIGQNSSINTYDDGYPSGGNYWSNCSSVDQLRGFYQNETGSDGIADTIYQPDSNNLDNYPLTKPYAGPNDIGITFVTTSKTVVGQGYFTEVTVKIINYGLQTETFNLTVMANSFTVQFQETTVTSRNSSSITLQCNVTSLAYGNYSISAYAVPVLGELDTTDNIHICTIPIHVGLPGDVSGLKDGVPDGTVNMRDVAYMISLFNTNSSYPNWTPNADVNCDDITNMKDIAIAIVNFNQHE